MVQSEFDDQGAVVTGAARGLGRAISGLLFERGARVIMVDLDAGGVAAAARALDASGARAIAVGADVAQDAEMVRVREAIAVHGNRLDILINNAGGWRYGTLAEISIADWNWTFDVNLKTVFVATRTLMDLMIARRYGRIVNVASADAYRAKVKLPHYAAAKAGVVSLTKSMAEELAPHGVLVNGVSPGAIATETAKGQGWLAERAKAIPLGRVAEPEDIAEAILFLASPRNRFVVGETMLVNGGMFTI